MRMGGIETLSGNPAPTHIPNPKARWSDLFLGLKLFDEGFHFSDFLALGVDDFIRKLSHLGIFQCVRVPSWHVLSDVSFGRSPQTVGSGNPTCLRWREAIQLPVP